MVTQQESARRTVLDNAVTGPGTDDNGETVHPLGRRLAEARTRAFVGRGQERTRFAAALTGGENSPSVIYVHGPGGIGKSSLLRQWAQEALGAGRAVVQLDGRTVGRSPAEFEDAARPALAAERAVLLVDSFEHCQWLETWLRDLFLPRTPQGMLAVIAGRQAPGTEWAVDPGWAAALDVVELKELNRRDAGDLLTYYRVLPDRHNCVIRFTGGNPLALSLAAAVEATGPVTSEPWSPSAQVLETLMAGLIGKVPSAAHRRALEVAAQTHTTTEELLASVLPGEDAYTLFSWLREQPFMEAIPEGLYPHDAARETLAADLRWRSPGAYLEMRDRILTEHLREVREGPPRHAMAALGRAFFLFRDSPKVREVYSWPHSGQVHSDPLRPDDIDTVLALATQAEGEESAELVRYWTRRQPEAFSVFRLMDTGRTVAFTAQLVLPAPPDATDVATDPAVAAAWDYCNRTAPVRAGEHIVITRFLVYPDAYQAPSAVMNIVHWRGLAEVYRTQGNGRAQDVIVHRESSLWDQWLDGLTTTAETRPEIGGHRYVLYVNDWRQVPFEKWLKLATSTEPARAREPGTGQFLTRDEFDDAVRTGLQQLRNPRELAVSDLRRSRAAAAGECSATTLATFLRDAIDQVGREPRGTAPHDALVAAYLSGAPTQEAAARRLGVPFGTFRRHLRQGIQRTCDLLWECELRETGS